MHPPITVALPGAVYLIPSKRLPTTLRDQAAEHPGLPTTPDRIAQDLSAVRSGVPARVESRGQDQDPILVLHTRRYLVRLFTRKGKGHAPNAYIISSVAPIRLAEQRRLIDGHLTMAPQAWHVVFSPRAIPPGANAYWQRVTEAWNKRRPHNTSTDHAERLDAKARAFLDRVERVIDAEQEMTTKEARQNGAFHYRTVSPVGDRRRGTQAVYDFQLVGDRRPQPDVFVQVRDTREQHGQVTRVAGSAVRVRFDRPVDWNRIPPQGSLEPTPNTTVYARQRGAVTTLREGRERNTGLLSALVEFSVRPITESRSSPRARLDSDQDTAFHKAVGVHDMLVVLGPPGTGKTRTISEIVGASADDQRARQSTEKILVTSHTHRAVDNVLPRLPRDLEVIRVGHDGKVTAEGQPYLLERRAADLRTEVTNVTGRALSAYQDVGRARQEAEALGRHLDVLDGKAADEAEAANRVTAAEQAVGGTARRRVETLRRQDANERHALARSGERVTRFRDRRDRAKARTELPLLGPVFRLAVRRNERRIDRERRKGDALRITGQHTHAALTEAEGELAAVLRADPAAQAARAALARARDERVRARSVALRVADFCLGAVRAIEVPPSLTNDAGDAKIEDELRTAQRWLAARLPLYTARASLLDEWHTAVSREKEQLYPELIRYADVIGATCLGAATRSELANVDFDLAIVDEAGQIGMSNALVPLVRARRGVLVGDHQQLPPFLHTSMEEWGDSTNDSEIQELLTTSVLERLAKGLPSSHVVPLTWQRRMPQRVAAFISSTFYDGKLHTAVERDHLDPMFRSPIAFVDTTRLPQRKRHERDATLVEPGSRPGYINVPEADLLTELAAFYARNGWEWAVIVPYQAQVARIRNALIPIIGDQDTVHLNVGTVDSFQGGERAVMLYGFTRSNPAGRVGFLDELRRANVAFTRVKHQLVLVGDMSTLLRANSLEFRAFASELNSYLDKYGDLRPYDEISERLTDLTSSAGER